MYSPHSPTYSTGGHHTHLDSASIVQTPNHSPRAYSSNYSTMATSAAAAAAAFSSSSHHYQQSTQCLKFKYFATFFVCTLCLALLSASLATHKWLVSKPIRVLRLGGQQSTNLSALMLTVASDEQSDQVSSLSSARTAKQQQQSIRQQQQASQQVANLFAPDQAAQPTLSMLQTSGPSSGGQQQFSVGNKFQGEIYFGLFNGVKVLNYGFGDRVSQLSVLQSFSGPIIKDTQQHNNHHGHHELINFKFWLVTLLGVITAIIFALLGSIFAIINFVMTPRRTLSGPVGLVIWNASACFGCLIAIFAWLIEYYLRLKSNVMTQEEKLNGWTSENRSQFGYSYYFVVLAFILHLVNIFIVSLVQFETWTSQKAAKRNLQPSRHSSACEGVIMLY